jgi:nicotinamidase-related amidase
VRILSSDLHGNAPDDCPVALLLIDVINDLEFTDGALLLEHAVSMARNVQKLVARAREEGIPIVYVNDNFGRWRADVRAQVEHCLQDGVRGQQIAELLRPAPEDYFVLKPKHSGFYCTNLEILLAHLGARSLILTGIAANNCVLFTANDAYMRDFTIFVPADCVASNTREATNDALKQMSQILKANTSLSTDLKELRSLGFDGTSFANSR